jgi:hypothetical protein
MRVKLHFVLLAIVYATVAWEPGVTPFAEKPRAVSGSPDIALPQASFLITFGIKDTALRAWDGEIEAEPGQAYIEADQFRAHEYLAATFSAQGVGRVSRGESSFPGDYLRSSKSWVASTREAPLHGPTTEWHIRSEEPKPIMQSPSIFIHAERARAAAPIRVKTTAGAFQIFPENFRQFSPQFFLNGDVRVDRVPPAAALASSRLGQKDFPSIYAAKSGTL